MNNLIYLEINGGYQITFASSENSKLHRREENRISISRSTPELLAGLYLQRPCFQCAHLYHGCIHGYRQAIQWDPRVSGFSIIRPVHYPRFSIISLVERGIIIYSLYITDTSLVFFVVSRVCILFFFKSFFNFYETLQEFRLENYVII